MKIEFIVPGTPRGKGRPRFGNRRVYTDSDTKEYEQLVSLMYRNKAKGFVFPENVPLIVTVNAFFPVPKNVSKRKREQMLSVGQRPTVRPDVDNILKSVLDGLNNAAYTDDKQVCAAVTAKQYGEEPCVIVTIQDIINKK